MSVLIFADQENGKIKKASFEALSYGSKIANQLGVNAEAVVLGTIANDEMTLLGKYGVKKVHHAAGDGLNYLDSQLFTKVIANITQSINAKVIVFSNNVTGKAIAPRLSARLKAGIVSGAIALPDISNGFIVKKSVFSGKAFANVSINTDIKIISLNQNAFGVSTTDGIAEVITVNTQPEASKVKIISTDKASGDIQLTDAERVVSGGRGLKGPENWALVTDFAKLIGAATACSRPVADAHWRPHNEHVGQTGGAIAPNLYFAIGISGAIQHLAGVNRSKVIVVINKDPEAPFFKAADYGIVGDAFEVMPKIIEAVKKLKGVS